MDEFDLLDELVGGRRLPELDCLDEGILVLRAEYVGSFDFKDVVPQRNQVGDGLLVHVFAGLHEGLHLPLLIVLGVQMLVLGARRDDGDVRLQLQVHFGQEALCRELDPALGRIRHDVHLAQLLRPLNQSKRDGVELVKFLLQRWRELNRLVVDETLVRR